MSKKFDKFFFCVLIFIFIILCEGIYSHFYYKVSALFDFIPIHSRSNINQKVWGEMGIIENIQHIFLLLTIIFLFLYINSVKSKNLPIQYKAFLYIYTLGVLYFFLEEISWGQHYFMWETPNIFKAINDQKETNLHNIFNLLNEPPRTMLIIWCSCSFIIYKFFSGNKLSYFKNFIFPDINLKKISLLIIFFTLPDLIVDKFNLHPGHSLDWLLEIRIDEVVDLLTFNFIRLSELIEFLLCYYILAHSYYIKKSNKLR